MDFLIASDAWLARLLIERGVALVYLIAFISGRNQFPALLGEQGLLPAPAFLAHRTFREAPSLFHWRYSDVLFRAVAWCGTLLSAGLLMGLGSLLPWMLYTAIWLVIWFLYQSIVNVGQTFYSFGWESMLLEAGFFAAFLGPSWMAPSIIPLFIFRWMLFRVELGAGLIKLRAGGVWLDRTALDYHHETQPMPNPLSRFAHHLPRRILHGGVLFSHFVQVIVPFGLFLPQPVAGWAALLIIGHQMLLVMFGNYSWLNALTIVLAFSAIPDRWLAVMLPVAAPAGLASHPLAWDAVLTVLGVWTVFLSIAPARNLCSRNQLMNYSWNRWHLVNAYGAFGSVTKQRYEIIIEGTAADDPHDAAAEWLPYEFKAKPGRLSRIPPIIAPYHLRLGWLMWFLPFSVLVTREGIYPRGYEPWFIRFIEKLFENDRATLKLIKGNPFRDKPPRFIRARYFLYQFTSREEHHESGNVWKRTCLGEYLAPVDRESLLWQ